jgi:hypothetical protein
MTEVLKPESAAVQSDAAFRRGSDHDDLGYGHRPLAPANPSTGHHVQG